MKSINSHIDALKEELKNPNIGSQKYRHLTNKLDSLEKYKERYPFDDRDPTPLELYCNEFPNALACRCYE